MLSKLIASTPWPQYVPAIVLLVSILAALLRVLLLDWSDPYHCNSLLTEGRWLDGDFQNWQPDSCMMYKYGSKDIDRCLKSKRVVFIGDSITRQIFFSMAHLADPSLPAAPPTSFEKHSDHSFPSGTGTWFDFFWDPFLNSTKTYTLLRGGGYGGRDNPGLLVIGSGLWFLRYADSSGGISAWEGTIERVLDAVSMAMPGLADEVVLVPVQEPAHEKLSPERAAFINHADIDAMNSDLVHRLSSSPTSYNDREIVSDGHPQPPLTVLFPAVFNKMLDPSQTEDGLHYNDNIMSHQAQILLNLRCNDLLPKKYPFDKTCCVRYPRPSLLQLLFLAVIVLYGPLAYALRPKYGKEEWFSTIMPSEEYTLAVTTFGLAIGICFAADRTGLWAKEQKQFNVIVFAALCILALIAGFSTVKREGKDLGFLNREQTDEWKGWMQLFILIYHYMGASQINGIYAPVRVLVSGYLFMTGYGHTTFYLKKAHFGFHRVARVLVRLNLLTIALAYAMDTDYLFYYFAPLVSFWYLVVYATLAVMHQYNERTAILLVKIAVSASFVAVIHSQPFFLEGLFRLLQTFGNIHWSAKEWCFRVNLDILIVYLGMITSILYSKLRENRAVDHPRWPWLQRGGLTACGIALFFFLSFELSRKDKFAYNAWHPFVSTIPVMAFVLLRNATPVLRAASSKVFAFIGTCSLETYILQYHIWLAADTKGLLIIIPGASWRPLNFIVTTILLVWISHRVAVATGELTNLICGTNEANQGLPFASSVNSIAESYPIRFSQARERPVQIGNEEGIPLVQTVPHSDTDGLVRAESQTEHNAEKVEGSANSPPSAELAASQEPLTANDPSALEEGNENSDGNNLRSSSISKWFDPSSMLPVRMGCILVGLWLLNVAWPTHQSAHPPH